MKFSLLSLAGPALLCIPALSVPAAAQSNDPPPCVFSGITTQDFDYNPDDYTAAFVTWAPDICSIHLSIEKISPYFIGNYYLVQHYLMYGTSILDDPIFVDWPFYGHNLLIMPDDILGPFDGGSSDIAPPNDPNLVGQTFYLQAIAVFITTVHFPIEPEYVLQQGIALTFN
ncbi:MAG: hypothetical protein HY286_12685 [Planctomycetes bacterium]|nr:hypothetical protein [Planctomycetota bacterium]